MFRVAEGAIYISTHVNVPEQNISGEQLQTIYNNMNAKQQELFQPVRQSIQEQLNGSRQRMRWFVTGGAGVGKTFTFSALKNLVKNCFFFNCIFKIRAQDQIIDVTRNVDNVVPADVNKTGGLTKELKIFIGAKVMLRSNINVEKGLVNGAIGNITEIIWPHFRRDQMYDTDVRSVRIDFGNENIQLIEPKAIQFSAKYNYGTIERIQLPIILCRACTVHKMHGYTVDHAVVYLGRSLFQDGQAYVALSRLRSLNGLQIEELDCSKLSGKNPFNESAIREMERMRQYRPP